mgnify:CR=1 FL=1
MLPEEHQEKLASDAEHFVKMLRKAMNDRAKAQKRVLKWRAKCAWICNQGATWKRSWFKLYVPPHVTL